MKTEALIKLRDDFLAANKSVLPLELRWKEENPRLEAHLARIKCVGYYRPHYAVVVRDRCTLPGRGYSWPRHCSDRTELGVLAHEMGHHVHQSLPWAEQEELRKIFPRKGLAVTGYEPNVDESIAESFRLFLLNPDLLAEGRLPRFRFFEREMGLHNIEKRDWKTCLGDCPKRITEAAERWLSRKKPHHSTLEGL